MSDLYVGKVLKHETRVFDTTELFEAFADDIDALSDGLFHATLERDGPLTHAALDAAAQRALEGEGVDALVERGRSHAWVHVDAVEDPLSYPLDDLGFYREALWLQTWLSQRDPARFPAVPLTRVQLELVQIHADAWFPESGSGQPERAWCCRALTEAQGVDHARTPIYQHFDGNFGADAWAREGFGGGSGSVRGIVLHTRLLETVDVDAGLRDPERFRADHADAWWIDCYHDYDQPSSNAPYQVRRYELLHHPAWAPTFANSTFDSRAHEL